MFGRCVSRCRRVSIRVIERIVRRIGAGVLSLVPGDAAASAEQPEGGHQGHAYGVDRAM
jgi:hypothetical protein